ncbi:PMS1 protein homolog 1-like [Limulus polyphemus]|uniref:PMS1 protein homolog 1-like n=1 Tax=Limulus polyphemus TaxID=6850 RepID=A0ABM1S245_LIMPO|nr:PMS1 protein homolog 1-like [Limulus polyphemus]XP_022237700.1 PMS1 protein homolog 1-like [Limulus polyphemus]
MSVTIKQLPVATSHLLASSQVITSCVSVVKELVENSLDAEATSIDIKLENSGFDRIEVRDNGLGVSKGDVQFMGQPHFTSKISSHFDLDTLKTYGFRGEALGALCSVADVTVVTKTEEDKLSFVYTLDHCGRILSSKPSPLGQGTTVAATKLFKNLPVRKQFYGSAKRKKEEIKKVEDLLMAFSIMQPGVRFSLYHNHSLIWQKIAVPDFRSALIQTLGNSVFNMMIYVSKKDEETKIFLEGFLPKPGTSSQQACRTNPDRCFVAVNRRPVHLKEIDKLIRQHICSSLGFENSKSRWPVCFLSIDAPPSKMDVNIDPNKSTVLFHCKEVVSKLLTSLLESTYGSLEKPEQRNRDLKATKTFDRSPSFIEKDDNGGLNQKTYSSEVSSKLNSELVEHSTDRPSKPVVFDHVKCRDKNHMESANEILEGSITHTSLHKSISSSENLNAEDSDLFCPDTSYNVDESVVNCVGLQNNESEHTGSTKPNDEDHISLLKEIPEFFDISDQSVANCASLQDNESEHTGLCKPNNEGQISLLKEIPEFFDSSGSENMLTENMHEYSDDRSNPSSINKNTLSCGRFTYHQSRAPNCDKPNEEANTSTVEDKSYRRVSSTLEDTVDSSLSLSKSPNQEKTGESHLWSGGFLKDQQGKLIQPVSLLQAKTKRLLTSPDESSLPSSPNKKKKRVEEKQGQPTLYDMLGNRPIKRPQSAFNLFCAENQTEVTFQDKCSSSESFKEILKQKWENLPDKQKMKYHIMAERDAKRYNKEVIHAEKQNAQRKKDVKTSNKSKHYPDEVTVEFDINKLNEKLKHKQQSTMIDTDLILIGQLPSSGMWLCIQNSQVMIINHFRMQEALLYHRLVASHSLEVEKLQEPILLTQNIIGDEWLWQLLLKLKQLDSMLDSYKLITDDRLTKNGFHIRTFTSSGELQAEITHLATSLPFYGITDLKEILQLINKQSESSFSPSQCRPQQVLHFFQGEAVRIARKSLPKLCKNELEDLIQHCNNQLPQGCSNCLHNKPFYHILYNLKELPLSQSQSG